MEKDLSDPGMDVVNGITLKVALGYRVCDTIVASNALTVSGKAKLKEYCKNSIENDSHSVQLNLINNNLSQLTDKVKSYLEQSSNSDVTKHGRVKNVDLGLLNNIVLKHDGNNSTLKNITCCYNKTTTITPVSKSTIYLRLRRRLNFSYRKINVRNVKVTKPKQRRELMLFYARIKEARKRGDLLIWKDESSFNDRNNKVKSWQKRKSVSITHYDKGRVKSVSVMSALTDKSCLLTHYNKQTNDSNDFIRFTKELVQCLKDDVNTVNHYNSGRCHLILDNARIHRSEDSFNYLRSTNMYVTYLPTYSPTLNNVELYWGRIKSHTRKYVYLDM